MKKNNTKYGIIIFFFIFLFLGCEEEKLEDSFIEIPSATQTELDQWIDTQFRIPYNIQVIYRWNSASTDQSRPLVPPKEELVQTFLQAVIRIWIHPYNVVAENKEELMKSYTCRELVLVGSGSYNQNSVTLGLAANGYRITLYTVNQFDLRTGGINRSRLQQFFRTMHHEFAHVLNQRKPYDPNFKQITGGYTADWTSISDAQARELGFISAYARSDEREDFVETLVFFITSTEGEWQQLLNSIQNTKGRENILLKLQSVSSYMQETYKVDIRLLREEITKAISEVANGNLEINR
jgi:substrate import-associated zinc metallohydrolase lipoprotein